MLLDSCCWLGQRNWINMKLYFNPLYCDCNLYLLYNFMLHYRRVIDITALNLCKM